MRSKTDTRCFEYKDERSSKFWEIQITGNNFTVRYGKVGTDGQTQSKEFTDAATAEKQALKMISEKLGKGYKEIFSELDESAIFSVEDQVMADVIDYSTLNFTKKLKLAEDPITASGILERLADDKEQGVPGSYDETFALRRAVAANPKSSINLLMRLAEDDEIEVRFEVGRNPSIPLELINRLYQDGELVESIVLNKKCPSQLLEKLAKVKDDEIRNNVAANPNCPGSLLKKWAKFKNINLRASVASNPSTPEEILNVLVTDAEVDVRVTLASNPSCPIQLLERLSQDEDHDVRKSVAGSMQCPIEVLVELGNDEVDEVLIEVARNPNTPFDVLKVLGSKEELSIRIAVADNPKCPADLRKSALVIPSCRYPTNCNLEEVMEPVTSLSALLSEASARFPGHPFFDHYGINDIRFCSPAWGLKLSGIPTKYADRSRSMLVGPFFTSDKYPWPVSGDAKYASPIVQVDLKEISTLRGIDYGDGLLQVFRATDEFFTRVVPREDLITELMTPFATCSCDEFAGYFTDNNCWLGDDGVVLQITGYDEPVLSANVYASDGAPDDDAPEIFKEIFLKMKSLECNDDDIHMFGTFYPIQYRHSSIGKELFMTLPSDECYSWGDLGSAQIFCDRDDHGKVNFIFEWSCY